MSKIIKIGLYSFTGCGGCFNTLNTLKNLPNLLEKFNFIDIKKDKSKIDYLLIEGTPITKDQLVTYNEIKSEYNKIILFGSCSVDNFSFIGFNEINIDKKNTIKFVGCPIGKDMIKELFNNILLNKQITNINHPVCQECNNNEIPCLLLKNKKCDGPNTIGKCHILCPKYSISCNGCRTKLENGN